MQINIGNVDPATGRYTGEFKTFALCGYVRDKVRFPAAHCVMHVEHSPPGLHCIFVHGWIN